MTKVGVGSACLQGWPCTFQTWPHGVLAFRECSFICFPLTFQILLIACTVSIKSQAWQNQESWKFSFKGWNKWQEPCLMWTRWGIGDVGQEDCSVERKWTHSGWPQEGTQEIVVVSRRNYWDPWPLKYVTKINHQFMEILSRRFKYQMVLGYFLFISNFKVIYPILKLLFTSKLILKILLKNLTWGWISICGEIRHE